MAFVQRAHRRHKADRAILFATQLSREGHHALSSVYYFHKRKVWDLRSFGLCILQRPKIKDRRPTAASQDYLSLTSLVSIFNSFAASAGNPYDSASAG